ncbi:M15 family metallopeptidase [Aquimarina sp. U1-2]|uniref:M15 family metallopeptidase n=1 Tax=Aquimarina sp. U1-2 TaxID=2823141 RepID=UPI001AECE0B0|nr:M15 family metallopeptidase [Aquimarina sp. U1-2]MBP2834045.1 M15 family metallopeptidase [Aquimarina sp. U1-2]
MSRREFIKTTSLGLLGVSLLSLHKPQLKFFSKDQLMGKGNPVLFGDGYQLRKKAHEAFVAMKNEAITHGFKIKVVSSYRNYAHQNRIWERKYQSFLKEGLSPDQTIEKIIEYSTIPGTSRHHWGTDIDIVDGNAPQPKHLLLEEHFEGNGPFCPFKEWLDEHAERYDFHLVYTNTKDRKGFKYEPWHYSYAPLSKPMLQEYRTLNIKEELQNIKLLGSENFSDNFIRKYISQNILDINRYLL